MPIAEAELRIFAPAPQITGCADCEQLAGRYELAKRDYAAAVDVLFATGYRFMDRKYAALKNAVETTRTHWETARANLERHHRDRH
jgi:hypothetical protein